MAWRCLTSILLRVGWAHSGRRSGRSRADGRWPLPRAAPGINFLLLQIYQSAGETKWKSKLNDFGIKWYIYKKYILHALLHTNKVLMILYSSITLIIQMLFQNIYCQLKVYNLFPTLQKIYLPKNIQIISIFLVTAENFFLPDIFFSICPSPSLLSPLSGIFPN